jgi:hypothetical protein
VKTVAALYVATNGCYYGLPDVDPWDKARDARLYEGPHPVVAHPPCERWGKMWNGGSVYTSRGLTLKKGDDGGCFASALAAVRAWGGVLEHPCASQAWDHFGINNPPRTGGWISADFCGGWTCCVDQGHYGHRANKATWLYAVGCPDLPTLIWGPSPKRKPNDTCNWLTHKERAATPLPFRDLLLSLARMAGR